MEALIFDMDGVIIDSQAIADELLIQTCLELGISLNKAELRELTGASGNRFWSYVKKKIPTS